jgi:predicted nucleotidyltransferase/uncharacterized protein (UPF0332 family)
MTSLATASLTEAERRALERLVDALQRELGDDLHAVWLYGSRARGEPPHQEGSDIDLLVIASPGAARRDRIQELVVAAAKAEGLYYGWFSFFLRTPEWVAQRRAVEAFYIQQVDRDKIVLAGGEVDAPPDFTLHAEQGQLRRRTVEYLELARRHLGNARAIAEVAPATALKEAYFAALNVARGALSEEDRFVRRHGATWDLIHELFVETGKLPPGTYAAAAALQAQRELADYGPDDPDDPLPEFTKEDAAGAIAAAEEFLRAVEELLGA